VIFYVVECLEYEFLERCDAPNIKSLEPHPAYSFGRNTRAAVAAILGGMIPECVYRDCYHNEVRRRLTNPFFLTDLRRRGVPIFLFIANGWAMELLRHFMPDWLWEMCLRQNKSKFDTREFIDRFLELEPDLDSYFAYFHVQETHPPFFGGDEELPEEEYEDIRRRAVEYADELLTPLLKLDSDLLVVCGDHHIEHDGWHPKSFETFVATRGELK